MKSKFSLSHLLVTILVMAVLAFVALEALAGTIAFSGKGTAFGTNRSYFIASASADKIGTPAVDYLNVSTDNSNGVVQFYSVNTNHVITSASSGATNKIYVASGGTLYTDGAVAVIRHAAADTYERHAILGSGTATTITLSNATASAVAVGDSIWLMSASAKLPVGSVSHTAPYSTAFAPGHAMFWGEPGQPLLVEVTGNGTNTININAISGRYRYEMINGEKKN